MKKFLLWTAATLVVLVVVGILVASHAANAFLRGEGFRQQLSAGTGKAMRGTAEFAPLEWSGSNVHCERLSFQGDEVIQKLTAKGLRTSFDWRMFLREEWKLNDLTIESTDIVLNIKKPDTIATPPWQQPDTAPEAAERPWYQKLFSRWFKREIIFGSVISQRTKVSANWAGHEIVASGAHVTLTPVGRDWKITGRDGTLTYGDFPQLRSEEFSARTSGTDFYLTSATFRSGERGRIVASGAAIDGTSSWQVTASDLPPWLPPEWNRHISGRLSGTADVTVKSADNWRVAGKFALDDAVIENLTLLDRIALFTLAQQFKRLTLSEFKGNYEVTPQGTKITNFVGEARGLIRASGDIAVDSERRVKGKLTVGISPQVLQWLPATRNLVFTDNSVPGYLSTDVEIGGTLDNLTENLSPRLIVSTVDSVLKQGTGVIKKATDTAKDLIKGTVNLLIGP